MIQHRVALLVVVGQLPHGELAENFVVTVPRIAAFLASHAPPLIAKVHRPSPADLVRNPRAPGTVSGWYPKSAK